MNKFSDIQIIKNQDWNNKALSYIDNFYINSALVTVYNKKNIEFINIQNSIKKMYQDVYENKIKIPETIDDNWTSATLSRYVEEDIKRFLAYKSIDGDCKSIGLVRQVLSAFSRSKVLINYLGLKTEFKLDKIKNVKYECEIITTIRGKTGSSIKIKGDEIDFSVVTIPANKLQKHEELILQIFLNVKFEDEFIKIILTKFGEKFSKIFIDNSKISSQYEFSEFGIKWGSFDINRGV